MTVMAHSREACVSSSAGGGKAAMVAATAARRSGWPDWYAAKLGYMHGGKIAVREPKMMTYDEAVAAVGDVGWRALPEPRSWKTT